MSIDDFYDFENSLHFSISEFPIWDDFENTLHFSISDFPIFTIEGRSGSYFARPKLNI